MAHELIGTVTATPTGPETVVVNNPFAMTGSFTLNGANPPGTNSSAYSLAFQHVTPAPGSAFSNVDPAVHSTEYVRSYTPTTLGKHTLRCEASLIWSGIDPDTEEPIGGLQQVQSNTITIHVVHQVGEMTLDEREGTLGFDPRSGDVELESRSGTLGLSSRSGDIELSPRTGTVGLEP